MRDDDYIDGIKLPTDRFKNIEILIESVNDNISELFKIIHEKIDQEPLKMIGELSMKLNKMQESLREFEKEKVEPLRERADLANECFAKLDNKFSERIQRIENYINSHRPAERIEKLESLVINGGIPTVANYALQDQNTCRHQWDNTRGQTCPPTRICVKCGFAQEWVGDEIREIKQECEHEWDSISLLSNPPKIQCKKCKFTKTFENYFMATEFNVHPRDEVKLCKHMFIESKCTACY